MAKTNVEIITESIDKIMEGLSELKTILPNLVVEPQPEPEVETPKSQTESKTKKVETKVEETPTVAEESTTTDSSTIEDRRKELEDTPYNKVKSIAGSYANIKATGKKADLIEKILGVEFADVTEEEKQEVEETTQQVADEPNNEVDEPTVEEDEEQVEDSKNDLYAKVEKELEDYSIEDLADILEDIGKSPKGKRQALISKIVDAIEDGLLEFEVEDEEDVEETVEEPKEEPTPEPVEDEEDEEITDARRETMVEIREEIIRQYEEGEITDKEIKQALEKLNEKDEDCHKCDCPSEDRLECYIQLYQSLVDDEGETHGLNEPYFVNDQARCCGCELKELENENLYCETCGTEYEVE